MCSNPQRGAWVEGLGRGRHDAKTLLPLLRLPMHACTAARLAVCRVTTLHLHANDTAPEALAWSCE